MAGDAGIEGSSEFKRGSSAYESYCNHRELLEVELLDLQA